MPEELQNASYFIQLVYMGCQLVCLFLIIAMFCGFFTAEMFPLNERQHDKFRKAYFWYLFLRASFFAFIFMAGVRFVFFIETIR